VRPLFALLAVVVPLVSTACDPGFEYRPVGWERVGRHEWRARVEGVEIRTGTYSALISSTYFGPEFDLSNGTEDTVVIEGAHLIVERGSYPARFPGAGELRWRRASAGSSKRNPLAWGFEDSATDELGDRPRILLDVRIGEEQHELEIEYERDE